MSFIDFSDTEGMIDLFQEFVRDELNACPVDADRGRFLTQLLEDVRSIREGGMADAAEKLHALHDAIANDFSEDPAATHLADLIAELEELAP